MTARERTALSRYEDYKRSNATDLSDVYGRYSTAKARAWNYCKDLMRQHEGWGLRIITHNGFMFTAGFEFTDPETGVLMFMYITKTYDEAVEV